jgi:hypothetical protein
MRSPSCVSAPTREGYYFQHVQAITVAIDSTHFLNQPYGVG